MTLYERGACDGEAGKCPPPFPTPTSSWAERLYHRGCQVGAARRGASTIALRPTRSRRRHDKLYVRPAGLAMAIVPPGLSAGRIAAASWSMVSIRFASAQASCGHEARNIRQNRQAHDAQKHIQHHNHHTPPVNAVRGWRIRTQMKKSY
jgi:hypothetical protein